jgi:hypothetical protein
MLDMSSIMWYNIVFRQMWGNTHIENRRLNLLTIILTSYSMTIGERYDK